MLNLLNICMYFDKIWKIENLLKLKSSWEATVIKAGKVFKVQPRKLNWMVLSATLNSKKNLMHRIVQSCYKLTTS